MWLPTTAGIARTLSDWIKVYLWLRFGTSSHAQGVPFLRPVSGQSCPHTNVKFTRCDFCSRVVGWFGCVIWAKMVTSTSQLHMCNDKKREVSFSDRFIGRSVISGGRENCPRVMWILDCELYLELHMSEVGEHEADHARQMSQHSDGCWLLGILEEIW